MVTSIRNVYHPGTPVTAKEDKTEREAREFGGLGAKPPVGSGAEPLYVRSRCFGRFGPFVVFESCELLC